VIRGLTGSGAVCAALALGACTRFHATWPSDVAGFCRLDAVPAAETAPPHADAFLAGLEVLGAALPRISSRADVPPTELRSERLVDLEPAFRRVLPSVGLADAGALYVHGWSVRVAAPPARCAEVLLDLEAEKAALSADEAEVLGERTTRDGLRRVARLGLLDMGEGLFKFDFRWTFAGTSRRRADGVVLVRYDFVRGDRPQRVAAFSGVAVIAPDGAGSRVTEILAVGSTVSPPFFLKGKARDAVADILTKRARRLAERMTAR
jgi:hypothetical protein